MPKNTTKILLGRAAIEITGILFLFYANLLMGEFTGHSRIGKTLSYALHDIFTKENFLIGVVALQWHAASVKTLHFLGR